MFALTTTVGGEMRHFNDITHAPFFQSYFLITSYLGRMAIWLERGVFKYSANFGAPCFDFSDLCIAWLKNCCWDVIMLVLFLIPCSEMSRTNHWTNHWFVSANWKVNWSLTSSRWLALGRNLWREIHCARGLIKQKKSLQILHNQFGEIIGEFSVYLGLWSWWGTILRSIWWQTYHR
jgi:hypothetical protein